MDITEEKLIGEIKSINGSVDRLMSLIDGEILTASGLLLLAEKWDEITDIPFLYAKYLVDDDLEQLVRTVVADYKNSFALGDFISAMRIHNSNMWMSQVIGAADYQTLSDIYSKYGEEICSNSRCPLFEGITTYQELINRYKSQAADIEQYILKADEMRGIGNYAKMYEVIMEGLALDPCSCELYFELGEYYCENSEEYNINKAFLCFENAAFYCDNEDDSRIIQEAIDCIIEAVTVKKVATVIVSYNACYLQQQNIIRIRESLPADSYRIIVVDNASNDGVYEWLSEQDDILLHRNDENLGFGIACNQGVQLARENGLDDYDIFLLNNDTRLAMNALFWLRMGLYEDNSVGATGSISNYAGNEQQIEIEFTMPGDYLEYGKKNNIPMKHPYEERVRLSGFAMLVRGELWEKTTGMDPVFSPGYFEDDDLCMKIKELGYSLVLCKNSFIYHAGSQSFGKIDGINELLQNNYVKFIDKYGFAINEYAYSKKEIAGSIADVNADSNILFVGSRLGADMAYIASVCPNALVYGIESSDRLKRHSCMKENVYDSIESLLKVIGSKRFDYVFINMQEASDAVVENISDITGPLSDNIGVGTVIVKYGNASCSDEILYNEFDKIKLIIWDLDETFWRGTLSEGRVEAIPENIELVKRLADCGIVNSISSKNNQNEAIEQLTDMGIADYFVFNNINWEGKGSQIADKLNSMGLKAKNTLFVDDNVVNLEEAVFFAKEIMTATPDIIPKLIAYTGMIPASDTEHKRLDQYKVLEEKRKKEAGFASRDEFLRFSNIKVDIYIDCEEQIDRITEMVMRTNQLNYTKIRSGKDDIASLIESPVYECAYITAKDRFGDHGIVGFYALNIEKKELVHFLFSCRVMGMGVEQYIYNILDRPTLNVSGEVAVKIEQNKDTPWINMAEEENGNASSVTYGENEGKLLLKGPCDMSAMEPFIDYGNIAMEFNYVNDKGVITTGQNHSVHIIEGLEMTEEEMQLLLNSAPMVCHGDFETDMFSGAYKYICYSLLPDCHAGLYRNRQTGRLVSFGSKNYDITNPEYWNDLCQGNIVNHSYPFTREVLMRFADEWEFVGCTPIDVLITNMEKMYSKLSDNTELILILGSETESEEENGEFADHAPWHAMVNRAIEEFAASRDRVKLINPTDYIRSQSDFAGCTNHYSRNIYYAIAHRINELTGCDYYDNGRGEDVENDIAYCIMTYNHPDVIREVIGSICDNYDRHGIDIYIYDSSPNELTRLEIDELIAQGKKNLFYIACPQIKTPDEKFIYVMQGNGLSKRYRYIWPSKDRTIIFGSNLDRICENAREEYDAILFCADMNRSTYIYPKTKPVYSDCAEVFRDFGALSTSWESVLFNYDSMISGINWDEYIEEYNLTSSNNFGQPVILFSRLADRDRMRVAVVDANPYERIYSQLSSSMWTADTFDIFGDHWIKAIYSLPDVYDEYKLKVIKEETMLPELFGSLDNMMYYLEHGILNSETYDKIKGIWSFLSDIPLRHIEYLIEDNFDALVKEVIAEYNSSKNNGDYIKMAWYLRTNSWLEKVLGENEYQYQCRLTDEYIDSRNSIV